MKSCNDYASMLVKKKINNMQTKEMEKERMHIVFLYWFMDHTYYIHFSTN